MKTVGSLKRPFDGLSAKAKAKLASDHEAARNDPLALKLVDNLNKAAAKDAKPVKAKS